MVYWHVCVVVCVCVCVCVVGRGTYIESIPYNMVHVLYVHLCNLHVYMYTNLCVCGGGGGRWGECMHTR